MKYVEFFSMIIGILCFIFIGVDSFMHFGFTLRMHNSTKPMIFISTEMYWILNLFLSIIGGALVSLKSPFIGVVSGLITGILLQITFTLYLFWRVEVNFVEILIPATFPFIIGTRIHERLLRKKSINH